MRATPLTSRPAASGGPTHWVRSSTSIFPSAAEGRRSIHRVGAADSRRPAERDGDAAHVPRHGDGPGRLVDRPGRGGRNVADKGRELEEDRTRRGPAAQGQRDRPAR